MKKIYSTKKKEYWPITIYQEDLKELEEILRAHVKPDSSEYRNELEIRAGNWKYDSIDELIREYPIKNGEKIPDLNIYLLSLDLNFSKFGTTVSWDEDKTHDSGAFYKVDEVLSSKVKKPHFIYQMRYFFLASIITVSASIFDSYTWLAKYENYLLVIYAIPYLFFLYTGFYVGVIRRSLVYLRPRKSGGIVNWIKKHKNELVVGIILIVVGGLINEAFDRYKSNSASSVSPTSKSP